MAASSGNSSKSNFSAEFNSLSAGSVWKGENESDAELTEAYDLPLGDAGAWTEEEACKVYREKLIRLRDLYVGQLDHLNHTLQEKRRQFLLQWQYTSRKRKQGGTEPKSRRTLEEVACARYRKKSGEEALLQHKLKQKRCTASLEYFLKKDMRDIHKAHNQYLIKQHHRLSQSARHCNNHGCDNKCLPFSSKCSRHICDDDKQLLYTKCSYVYPSGNQCTNPIPKYLDPLLCGGHCDNIKPPLSSSDASQAMDQDPVSSHIEGSVCLETGVGDALTGTSDEVLTGNKISVESGIK